tara:strand:+ start:709 stop:900 length:192 start_codon:yes stop_codon:yes gene_type:complete
MKKITLKYSEEPMKSKGLGDTIEKFTKATGIKKAVDAVVVVTGKPCGCEKRKDTLNRMFPYKK